MKPNKAIAWVCIFSTLLLGCYSSVMVVPTAEEKEKINSGHIESVVTKGGTEYEFDSPPAVYKETIIGEAKFRTEAGLATEQVSIPLSEVRRITMKEFDAGITPMVVVTIGSLLACIGILYALMRRGA